MLIKDLFNDKIYVLIQSMQGPTFVVVIDNACLQEDFASLGPICDAHASLSFYSRCLATDSPRIDKEFQDLHDVDVAGLILQLHSSEYCSGLPSFILAQGMNHIHASPLHVYPV